MKRDYTSDEYRRLGDGISEKIPHLMIGADVIVGFPGETDGQFENTCRFIRSAPISYLHVFSYSDRKGTEASRVLDKVDPQVIHRRSEIMHNLGKEKWIAYIERFIDHRLNVLVEHRRDKKTGRLTGLSDNYIRVLVDGDDSLRNQIIPVRVTQRIDNKLMGET